MTNHEEEKGEEKIEEVSGISYRPVITDTSKNLPAKEIKKEFESFIKKPWGIGKELRKIRHRPLTKKSFLGISADGKSNLHKFENNIATGVIVSPINKLPWPKLGASQAKNVLALLSILQKANARREQEGSEKSLEVEFSLEEYALVRGHSEEEIGRRGKFLDDLKLDLLTGSSATYILDLESSTGNKRYAVRQMYELHFPKTENEDRRLKIIFNDHYRQDVYLLNSRQFSKVLLLAVQDKSTQKKDHLFYFHEFVMKGGGEWKGRTKYPIKVSNLLLELELGEDVRDRPRESFRVLSECVLHESESYQTIEKIILFHGKKLRVECRPEDFKNYKSFKEVLSKIELRDIRDALILFNPRVATQDEKEDTQLDLSSTQNEKLTSQKEPGETTL